MRATVIRIHVLGALLLFTLPASGEDEPLPKRAKVRIAPEGLSFRASVRITVLADGRTVLIPESRGGIRRFDAITGKPLDKRDVPLAMGLIPVNVSGDGKRAMIANSSSTVVRDVNTGEVVRELKSATPVSLFISSDAASASLSHDGKVLARTGPGRGGKGSVIVWEVEKGDVIFEPQINQPGAAIPVLSPDGKLLATRSTSITPAQGYTVQVWDIAAKKELFQASLTPGLTGSIACVFSPDGTVFAGSCGDGTIDVWDVKSGKVKFTLVGRTRQGTHLAVSPDGKMLAALAADGAVQQWNLANETLISTTEGPAALPVGGAQGLVFAKNDLLYAWGMIGPCPIIWEAPSGKVLTPVPAQSAYAHSIGFTANGKELITAGAEGRVVRWDIASGKPLGEILLKPSRAAITSSRVALNITRDATWGLALGNPSTVYDLKTGVEEFVVPQQVGFSGTSNTYPSTDNTKAVRVSVPSDKKKPTTFTVWDMTIRRRLGEIQIPTDALLIPRVAVSPDGTRLVTATSKGTGADRTLIVTGWDIKTGKKLTETTEFNPKLASRVVAVSNATVIVASGARLRAFDYELGRPGDVIEPDGIRGPESFAIAVSADQKRFSYGVQLNPTTYGVRVYDWPSGKALHTFVGHRAPVRAMTFSPDGKTLASASDDTVVLLWDLSTLPAPK